MSRFVFSIRNFALVTALPGIEPWMNWQGNLRDTFFSFSTDEATFISNVDLFFDEWTGENSVFRFQSDASASLYLTYSANSFLARNLINQPNRLYYSSTSASYSVPYSAQEQFISQDLSSLSYNIFYSPTSASYSVPYSAQEQFINEDLSSQSHNLFYEASANHLIFYVSGEPYSNDAYSAPDVKFSFQTSAQHLIFYVSGEPYSNDAYSAPDVKFSFQTSAQHLIFYVSGEPYSNAVYSAESTPVTAQNSASLFFETKPNNPSAVVENRITVSAPTDLFGGSISTTALGDVLVVGDPAVNNDEGSVFIFQQQGLSWNLVQELKAPTPSSNEFYGKSVKITPDGTRIVVGAPEEGTYGTVHIYALAGGIWTLEDSVAGVNTGPWSSSSYNYYYYEGDSYGESVDINDAGDKIIVGAPNFYVRRRYRTYSSYYGYSWNTRYYRKGGFFTLTRTGTNWQEVEDINQGLTTTVHRYGESLAMTGDGEYAVVSRPGSDSVEVFRQNGNSWTLRETLTRSGTEFGGRVAISRQTGQTLAVSDYRRESNSGVVYVFDQATSAPKYRQRNMLSTLFSADSHFGFSIDVNDPGDIIFVGAYNSDILPGDNAGKVFVYNKSQNNTWTEQDTYVPAETTAVQSFGYALATDSSGDKILVASPYDTSVSARTGVVYFYE